MYLGLLFIIGNIFLQQFTNLRKRHHGCRAFLTYDIIHITKSPQLFSTYVISFNNLIICVVLQPLYPL